MHHPKLAIWLAILSSLSAVSVSAQTPSAPQSPAPAPDGYRSAFEGYQSYGENKMVPWREANDTVGKVGGWRAYAKEAAEGTGHQGHGGHALPAGSAPRPAASQAKP